MATLPPSGGAIPWHPHHTVRLADGLGLSVDLSDGHLDLTSQDMRFAARGPSLSLDHTWDSLLAQSGVTTTAGQGWVDSLTPSMGGALTGTVAFTDDTGTVWQLPYTGPLTATAPYTAYQIPPGQPWQLTTAPTGTVGYTLTDFLDGSTQTFDPRGNLLATTDAYGNSNALSPGPTGPTGPLTLTNSGGRQLGFSYGTNGLLGEAKSYNWIRVGPDGAPLELLRQLSGTAGTKRYWYVLDGHQDVVGLVSATGNLVDQYGYDPWGALDLSDPGVVSETVPQPLRYGGYWYDGWDASLGRGWNGGPLLWYWLGQREYDPTLRRFLQPDPAAATGLPDYVYAADDPLDVSDPSGQAGVPTTCGAASYTTTPLNAATCVQQPSSSSTTSRSPGRCGRCPTPRCSPRCPTARCPVRCRAPARPVRGALAKM